MVDGEGDVALGVGIARQPMGRGLGEGRDMVGGAESDMK